MTNTWYVSGVVLRPRVFAPPRLGGLVVYEPEFYG
jgi:hypothetical protein